MVSPEPVRPIPKSLRALDKSAECARVNAIASGSHWGAVGPLPRPDECQVAGVSGSSPSGEVRVREPLGQIGNLAAKCLDFGNESRRLGAGAASSSSVRDRIESSNDG